MAGLANRRRWSNAAAAIVLVAFGARAAMAEDGVVEINQTRALAGGVTEDDAPGFPVTIGESGSYRLTGNLDVRGETDPEDAIAIDVLTSAGQVTIDLNGFSILGPTVCGDPPFTCTPLGSGVGIQTREGTFATIANGDVRGMGRAGILYDGSGAVFDLRATHNGECGICVDVFAIVRHCTAAQNGLDGIALVGGIARDNTARDNGRFGIATRLGALVSHNTANGNRVSGIASLDPRVGSLVVGNAVHANGGTGLALQTGSAFADNVMSANIGLQALGGTEIDVNLCNGTAPCR